MGSFAVGEVVLVRFPFSDLSHSKIRPALVIARAEFDNYILCQITSSPFSSKISIEITDKDINGSGLMRAKSYIRPDKIFTTDPSLIKGSVGKIKPSMQKNIHQALIKQFKGLNQ